MAGCQSSILILGIPAETYAYGLNNGYYSLGIVLAFVFATIFVLPVLHPLDITSLYRYFELRYGNSVLRYIIATCFVCGTLFFLGVAVYGACVGLSVIIGLPFWLSVVLYTVVTTMYTALGGIKAIIWTEVFQFTMMLLGYVLMITYLTTDAGGIETLFTVASRRLQMDDFRLDPRIRYQFWNTTFGSFTSFLYVICSQGPIQKIKFLPNITSARMAYIVCAPFYGLIYLLVAFQGVAIFAYYSIQRCDLLASNTVSNINAIVPHAVLDVFADRPGLPGLFVASLTSATLSTLSSGLNALAAVTYEDIICALFPSISDRQATISSKLISVGYGILATVVAFIVSAMAESVLAIFRLFMGCIDGPVVAVLAMSILFRRATTKGMVIGGLCGSMVTLWLILGNMLSDIGPYPMLPSGPIDKCPTNNVTVLGFTNISATTEHYLSSDHEDATAGRSAPMSTTGVEALYSMSFMLFSAVGFCVTIPVGILVSICTKPPHRVDERTIFAFGKRAYKNTATGDPEGETAL